MNEFHAIAARIDPHTDMFFESLEDLVEDLDPDEFRLVSVVYGGAYLLVEVDDSDDTDIYVTGELWADDAASMDPFADRLAEGDTPYRVVQDMSDGARYLVQFDGGVSP